MAQRVVVFVDYQNVYKGARAAFDLRNDHMAGQVHPLRLGLKLKGLRSTGRELAAVRLYRGMPSSKHDPKGFGACQRQVNEWQAKQRVDVFTRPLNYRKPAEPKEKGIDVKIAIDMVMMAMRREFDVAILFSADTDLLPAVEAVLEVRGPGSMEVAAWKPAYGSSTNRLRLSGQALWCHLLDQHDYDLVSDGTDYNRKVRGAT